MNRVILVIGLLVSNIVFADNPASPAAVKCAAGEKRVVEENYPGSVLNDEWGTDAANHSGLTADIMVSCVGKDTAKAFMFTKKGNFGDESDDMEKLVLFRIVDLKRGSAQTTRGFNTVHKDAKSEVVQLEDRKIQNWILVKTNPVLDTEKLLPNEAAEYKQFKTEQAASMEECKKAHPEDFKTECAI